MSLAPVSQTTAPAVPPVAAAPPATPEKAAQPAPAVVSQPAAPQAPRPIVTMAIGSADPPRTGEWQQDIFCPSIKDCCFASYCPSLFFGKIMTRYEGFPTPIQDANCCTPWCCLASFPTMWWARNEHRKKFGIRGSGFEDCMWTWFCPCLVLSQMSKELKIQTAQYSQPRGGMVYA